MSVLERPALVLNRNWQPIHVTTVVRALVMVWNETAKVVDPEAYVLCTWDEWCERVPPAVDLERDVDRLGRALRRRLGGVRGLPEAALDR